MTRSGRRPGNPDTKEAIQQAAKTLFAANGFTSTSMRQIAAAAGVDAALIHHYFKTKEQLFLATVAVDVDIPAKMAAVMAGDPAQFGRNFVATVLDVWDSPDGPGLVAAFRTMLADPTTSQMVREFISTAIIGTLVGGLHLATDDAPQRAGLVGSQMLGLIIGRYVLQLPPLVNTPTTVLVETVGSTVQRYLTHPLSS